MIPGMIKSYVLLDASRGKDVREKKKKKQFQNIQQSQHVLFGILIFTSLCTQFSTAVLFREKWHAIFTIYTDTAMQHWLNKQHL